MSLDPTKIIDDDDNAVESPPPPSPPDPVRTPPASARTGEPTYRILSPCGQKVIMRPGEVHKFSAFAPNAPFAADEMESAASKRRAATQAVIERLIGMGVIEPAEGT